MDSKTEIPKTIANNEPQPGRIARVLESLGIVDRAENVSRLTQRAILAGTLLVGAVVSLRAVEVLNSDNPAGLPRSTGPGSGVERTVPIMGQEDLPENPQDTKVVVAKDGDTVWGLVREELGPNAEIRNEVDAVVEERGGSDLQPGDKVEIPLEES